MLNTDFRGAAKTVIPILGCTTSLGTGGRVGELPWSRSAVTGATSMVAPRTWALRTSCTRRHLRATSGSMLKVYRAEGPLPSSVITATVAAGTASVRRVSRLRVTSMPRSVRGGARMTSRRRTTGTSIAGPDGSRPQAATRPSTTAIPNVVRTPLRTIVESSRGPMPPANS